MLNWLTANCELFGLPGQNWMLVVGGGLLLYIAALAISRRPARGYPLAQARRAHAPQSRSNAKARAEVAIAQLVAMQHCAYSLRRQVQPSRHV